MLLSLNQTAIWYFSKICKIFWTTMNPCTWDISLTYIHVHPSGNSKQVIFRTPFKTSSIVTISAFTKLVQVTVGSGHHLLSRKKVSSLLLFALFYRKEIATCLTTVRVHIFRLASSCPNLMQLTKRVFETSYDKHQKVPIWFLFCFIHGSCNVAIFLYTSVHIILVLMVESCITSVAA